jgi:uncharacterized metal-binding protein YceD (DUF177 family)
VSTDELKIKLPLNGLNDGEHNFDYSINGKFFENFEYSEIRKGKADVKIVLTKSSGIFELTVGIKGKVEVECDLCLEMFDLPFKFNETLMVKYGNADEGNEEVLYIKENDSEIDLTQYIYESVCLSLPYKKVHKNNADGTSGCNQLMLNKLNKHSVNEEETNTDPRWDRLRDIIN